MGLRLMLSVKGLKEGDLAVGLGFERGLWFGEVQEGGVFARRMIRGG